MQNPGKFMTRLFRALLIAWKVNLFTKQSKFTSTAINCYHYTKAEAGALCLDSMRLLQRLVSICVVQPGGEEF